MKHHKLIIILTSSLILTACDTNDQSINNDAAVDNAVTETVLDDVDSVEGTISDAMIDIENLDEANSIEEESQASEVVQDKKEKE